MTLPPPTFWNPSARLRTGHGYLLLCCWSSFFGYWRCGRAEWLAGGWNPRGSWLWYYLYTCSSGTAWHCHFLYKKKSRQRGEKTLREQARHERKWENARELSRWAQGTDTGTWKVRGGWKLRHSSLRLGAPTSREAWSKRITIGNPIELIPYW